MGQGEAALGSATAMRRALRYWARVSVGRLSGMLVLEWSCERE